jgi:hypothetical protein
MTVRQVWEYGLLADQRYYSASVGDADLMKQTN